MSDRVAVSHSLQPESLSRVFFPLGYVGAGDVKDRTTTHVLLLLLLVVLTPEQPRLFSTTASVTVG